ncbi:MAG: hypothetical protein ACI4IU_02310 [Candidatus Limousia pullorum]
MFLFKKKNQADKTKEARELIAQNAQSVNTLILLARNNQTIIEELNLLQEKLKYLIPSTNSKVVEYDKTIKNKLGDLRIALIKTDGENSKKITELIEDIKIIIDDRNVKI